VRLRNFAGTAWRGLEEPGQWLQQVSVSPAAREALGGYGELIGEFTRHMQGQDKSLTALARADQRAKWLVTIPGIGLLFGDDLVGGDRRDRAVWHGQGLFSCAGLVPWVRESAGHSHRGPISRCGSPRPRWVMAEAAHTAVRCSQAALFPAAAAAQASSCGACGPGAQAAGCVVRPAARRSLFRRIDLCGGVRKSPLARRHSYALEHHAQMGRRRFGQTLCALSTNRSLSHRLQMPYGQVRLFS